jgi:hypothetical protein
VATAIIPDSPGWRRKAHKLAAWSMAVWFLPLAWVLAVAPNISTVAQIICVLLSGYMTVGWALILTRKFKLTFLLFQATYVISLQLVILAAAYL